MLETENVELQDLYVISGELGMVDEAQKALEEAEALKKVCVFFRFLFSTCRMWRCFWILSTQGSLFCLVLGKLLKELGMLIVITCLHIFSAYP